MKTEGASGSIWTLSDEVAWGTADEPRIVARWAKLSEWAKAASMARKGGGFFDWDYQLFAKDGFPVCYLEVKKRRSPLWKYGDALFPKRKHDMGRRLLAEHGLRLIGVVEYGCGSLVEVDLSEKPSRYRDITRRDRPGMTPVPHVIYDKGRLRLLEGAKT
jgi:hypothetical protein